MLVCVYLCGFRWCVVGVTYVGPFSTRAGSYTSIHRGKGRGMVIRLWQLRRGRGAGGGGAMGSAV